MRWLAAALLASCTTTVVIDRSVITHVPADGERDRLCVLDGCWLHRGIDYQEQLCWQRRGDGRWHGQARLDDTVRADYELVPGADARVITHERCDPGTACAYVHGETSTHRLVFEGWNDASYAPCANTPLTREACAAGAPLLMFGMTMHALWLGIDPITHELLYGSPEGVSRLQRDPHSVESPACAGQSTTRSLPPA
jgi:hypothetical protein